MSDLTLEEQKAVIEYYQTHPVQWVEQFLDVKLWRKQKEFLNHLTKTTRLACSSGHALGKSFISSCAVLWFLFTHCPSKVITTAPTAEVVRTVLWSEIRTLHKRLEKKLGYAGEIFQKELRLDTDWWSLGISPDTPDAIQGKHSENQWVFVDEACGVNKDMFYALEAIATGSTNGMAIIGNPTNLLSFMGDVFSGKIPGWTKMRMSCYDSPNIYVDENGEYRDYDPLPYPALVSLKWINEKKAQWGTSSPQWHARVLGQFADRADDQLISNRYIAQALEKGLILRRVVKELDEGGKIISSADIQKLFREQAA